MTMVLMLLAMFQTAFADGLAGLRDICAPGDTAVLGVVKVSGIVVSDCASPNMELNPNVKFDVVDISLNDRTAYVQEADGSFGIRIVFSEAESNKLKRYDHVVLNLEGGVLCRESDPDRLTVRGLGASAVQDRSAGVASDVAAKQKFISELTDSDIYTQVVLKDLEMVFKDGTYADIYEPYGQYCEALHEGLYAINKRMDGWASLLRDSQGSAIYLLVNTKCPWRRTGRPLVAGTGPVTGIIVHTPMRRYGGDMGRYSIRPVDESDLGFSRKNKSSWKQLSGWCLDGTNGQQLEFEMLGIQGGVWKNGRKGDKLVSDRGRARALFWTDSDSYIHIDSDVNALDLAGRGYTNNGAIFFKGPSTGWFSFDAAGNPTGVKSFYLNVDARKVTGTEMAFNFSWYAGTQDANKGWGFPAEWTLEYSIDGGAWKALVETATGASVVYLRGLPWWDLRLVAPGISRGCRTSYDCGLGSQQRSFRIPADAFGHKFTIRIRPASYRLFMPPRDPSASAVNDEEIIRADFKDIAFTWIRFGDLTIDYK